MSNGDADTWDPELHGVEADGHEPPPTPITDASEHRPRHTEPPQLQAAASPGGWISAGQQPWQAQQRSDTQHQDAPSQHYPAQMQAQPFHHPRQGDPRGGDWSAGPGFNQMSQPRQDYPGAAAVQQRDADQSYEHYRDAGVLPWWAWAGIGAVVISCGLLAIAGLNPATLDSNRSAGFDPRFHEKYADMTLLPAGATFEGSVDSVSWDLSVAEINWAADEQAIVQTSLPEASGGMKYVGVELDLVSDYQSLTAVDEAFLFYYLTPGGQEYSQHYCGYGCLSGTGSTDYTYNGWIYFEVPDSVPEGGHLRINLLYSGQTDTLLELP